MAIVPPPSKDKEPEPLEARPVMSLWVRGVLVGIALGLTALFVVAACLNPYFADGSARRMETHRELGLPECTFKRITGLPCPSCGMTTSFALTIRGDLVNGVQANSVGVLWRWSCWPPSRGASPARSASAPCSSVRWSGR